MKKFIKLLLTLVVSVSLLGGISGCTSSGDIKNPLTPIGTLKNTNKETATVYFYRSSDPFGVLEMQDLSVLVDKEYERKLASDDTDPSSIMLTNRSEYMSKELEPGVHKFWHSPYSETTVSLEAGRTYYLSVAFYVGGFSGLEFRTRDDFLKEISDSKLIEWTGKCSKDEGCPTRVVNE